MNPKKPINSKFFSKLEITGSSENSNKDFITREEFDAGKAGYVWMHNKTGKLSFKK